MKKDRGLVNPKYQLYLLGVPLSFVFVGSIGIVNAIYSDDIKWGLKYSFILGFLISLTITLTAVYGYVIGMGSEYFRILFFNDEWNIHVISNIIFTPISLLGIRMQEKRFCV
jgi:hypothetical protein